MSIRKVKKVAISIFQTKTRSAKLVTMMQQEEATTTTEKICLKIRTSKTR
jgi:hypothetical protein